MVKEDIDEEAGLILPAVDLGNLREIENFVASMSMSVLRRDKLILALIKEPEYIVKLLDLWEMCEDLEDVNSIKQLQAVFRSIGIFSTD